MISEIYALWQYKSPFNLHHLQNPNNKSLIPTKKIICKWQTTEFLKVVSINGSDITRVSVTDPDIYNRYALSCTKSCECQIEHIDF
jgi:hypothetical protein